MRKQLLAVAAVSAMALSSTASVALAQDEMMSDGIVSAVLKAPIVPDGDVAGAATDIVINYDTSLDPAVPGRTLAAGNTIRITLPEDFESLGLPANVPSECNAFALECNAGVILQGWPQRPFPPVLAFHTLEMDGTHTLVYTAVQDLAPGDTPGIKQTHLILTGFVNPAAGQYPIAVEAQTGPDGAVETGTGIVTIRPEIVPSINVTSVFAKTDPEGPNENSIYQEAAAGASPAFNWDFLLFGADGGALVDVDLVQNDDAGGDIVQAGNVIGSFSIDAPDGATGQTLSGGPSVEINAPVSGLPTGRLTATFTAGDLAGTYATTLTLDGGTSQTMFVTVPA